MTSTYDNLQCVFVYFCCSPECLHTHKYIRTVRVSNYLEQESFLLNVCTKFTFKRYLNSIESACTKCATTFYKVEVICAVFSGFCDVSTARPLQTIVSKLC